MDPSRKFVFFVLWACLACGVAGVSHGHEGCTQSTCIHLSAEIHHGCPSPELPEMLAQSIDVRRSEPLLAAQVVAGITVPGSFKRTLRQVSAYYISPVGVISTLSPHIPSTVLRC